jgi:hypothetical protein
MGCGCVVFYRYLAPLVLGDINLRISNNGLWLWGGIFLLVYDNYGVKRYIDICISINRVGDIGGIICYQYHAPPVLVDKNLRISNSILWSTGVAFFYPHLTPLVSMSDTSTFVFQSKGMGCGYGVFYRYLAPLALQDIKFWFFKNVQGH